MNKHIKHGLDHWKTTTIGLIMAVATALSPFVMDGDFEIKRDWAKLMMAGIVAAGGFILKDGNSASAPQSNNESN